METNRLSKYRWVILAALMMITMMSQVQWLTHAPIARAAEVYYKGRFNLFHSSTSISWLHHI